MAATDYVCQLKTSSLKKARDELNEVPGERLSAVETFRTWIKQQPHITFPTDNTVLLLMFLRTAKFSQLRARAILEGYCAHKTAIPGWYSKLNTEEDMIVKALKLGLLVPLPKLNKNGCKILLERGGHFDPAEWKNNKSALMRAMLATIFYVMMDENVQVNGIIFFDDLSLFDLKHQTFWTLDELRNMHKGWQNNYPARFKGFNIYNGGQFFDAVLAIIYPMLSKKNKERLKSIGSNLEAVYKVFDMELLPEEYLPDDYTGPHAGSTSSLIEKQIKEMQQPAVRDFLNYVSRPEWGVDVTKKITDKEPQASFRKLNVD